MVFPNMDANVEVQFESAQIFCDKELLHQMQTPPYRVATDSKTFVDLPLRRRPEEVLDDFAEYLMNPNAEDYARFLADNFYPSPDDDKLIVSHVPADYTEEPPAFAVGTTSYELGIFAADLKVRWLNLARRFDIAPMADRYERIPDNPYTSLIPLPEPFFIPGGRFREVYYWDTLWIVYGLLQSDMVASAVGVVRNLLYCVKQFGFVPNGNRVYYLNRSQPPVLAEAVNAIFEALPTADVKREWLVEALPILEHEYASFMQCRRATGLPDDDDGVQTPLCVYKVNTNKPRPESYKEDMATASQAMLKRNDSKTRLGDAMDEVSSLILDKNRAPMEQMFQDIASGAESGWDFSSRWIGNQKRGLSSIKTSKIVPVCLNAVLLRDEKLLAAFHHFLAEGDCDDAEKYTAAAKRRAVAMRELMWCKTTQMWMDYDMEAGQQTDCESAAGLMPLWAAIWEEEGAWTYSDACAIVSALLKSQLMGCGGLATTTRTSHEQWDFPNCWAPLVDLVVVGLRRLEDAFPGCGGASAARTIALRTLRSMYLGWQEGRVMHEKYDCAAGDGTRGEGGEYEPQEGFGWSNGVALKLMALYRCDIEEAPNGTAFS